MKFTCNSIIVVLVAIICQEIFAEDHKNIFMAVFKECQGEHDLNDYDIEDMAKIVEDPKLEKNVKCLSHCILEKFELLDDNGKLNEEKFTASNEQFSLDIDTVIDCKAEHDLIDDPCEYGFEIFKCIAQSAYIS